MPLLDIAISQPCSCFRNSILAFRSETDFHNKIAIGNDRRLGLVSTSSWRTLCSTEKMGRSFTLGRDSLWRRRLRIKAVSTLELTSMPCKNEGVNGYRDVLGMEVDSVKLKSSDFEPSGDPTGLDEREKLRRMRISKANKGNTPWNKGKKHSPETLRRIKERTRLAMQDPKVKMKLLNLGHAQSEETRMKIGVGVRLGWERRRERLMLQDRCLFEWQDLIAVAARNGLVGEEELQWESYKIMDKQLEQEWLESVEQRRNSPRLKGNRRAPKSAEQKRKISEAIAAKWADPEYRNRVSLGLLGLSRFHGITEGVERKSRRKPAGDGETRISSGKKDVTNDLAKRKTKIQNQLIRQRRDRTPSYKDPLASTKLEMLKSIRAQRAAAVNNQIEAVTRAKLLIAEAEKAAEALQMAAQTSPVAQASLIESRMLIQEANQLIESLEIEDYDLSENSTVPAPNLATGMKEDAGSQNHVIIEPRKVNGSHSISMSLVDSNENFSLDKFMLPDLVNGNGNCSSYCPNDMLETEEKPSQTSSNGTFNSYSKTKNVAHPEPNPNGARAHIQRPLVNGLKVEPENEEEPKKQAKTIKKWVRGRLLKVAEEA